MAPTTHTRPGWQGEAETVVRAGATAALLGTALVHGAVVSHHADEWIVAGGFFVALEATEMLLAIGIVYLWSRAMAIAVALSSIATVAVWAVSRTVGVPVGPSYFRQPEAVGVPDLACSALEIAAMLAVLPWALGRPTERGRGELYPYFPGARRLTAAGALTGASVVLAMLLVAGIGLRAATSEHESGSHHDDAAGRLDVALMPPGAARSR